MLSSRPLKRAHNAIAGLPSTIVGIQPQKKSYDISDFCISDDDDKENAFQESMPSYVSISSFLFYSLL